MNFTPRQLEVIDLVGGRGFSYGRVAMRLGISRRTVEEYAVAIRDRAGYRRMNPRDALYRIYREVQMGVRNEGLSA